MNTYVYDRIRKRVQLTVIGMGDIYREQIETVEEEKFTGIVLF